MAGLCVLGVVLLIVIALGILAFWLLYRKLKQHESEITILQDTENALRASIKSKVSSSNNGVNKHGDSAIESGNFETESETGTITEMRSISSSSTSTRPRISMLIQEEKANVYGCTPHISQVMMVAQEFHKSTTSTDETVPPESVRMLDTGYDSMLSNFISNDWQHGRPNSVLLTSKGEPLGNSIADNKGMLVHETIDRDGGELSVAGVTLSKPKGALDSPTLVSLGVIWEAKFYPTLNRKQCLLSPIILCQPCGKIFNTPVNLSFPHCAENVEYDWNVTIMKRTGDLSDPTNWKEVTDEDAVEQNVDAKTVNLKLRHFTLYTCIGESKENKVAAKAVHLIAFVSQLTCGNHFKPRIYCLNNYREELQV